MTTNEIRAAFLKYFERQGHLPIPSASLVPFEDDPSVLLTIAGMQPLKSYFLGADTPPARRMTSSQKCFRTNDIDQVGHTARHLTFFEMLGNFSIGDYFKDDAIRFGWEVSTEVFGLDPDKIWITVFEGMEGVPGDDEALERWVEMGVPARAHPAPGRGRQLLEGRPHRPVRPQHGALPRPRPRVRPRGRPGRGRRPLPGVLEPGLHAVRARRRTGRCRRCRPRTSTPARGSSAWRPSSRTSPPSSRPTASAR